MEPGNQPASPPQPRFSIGQMLAVLGGVLFFIFYIQLTHVVSSAGYSGHSVMPYPQGIDRPGMPAWIRLSERALAWINHFPWNVIVMALVVFSAFRSGYVRRNPKVCAFLLGVFLCALVMRLFS